MFGKTVAKLFLFKQVLNSYCVWSFCLVETSASFVSLSLTEVFHVKSPVQVFHFCHPKALKYSLQVFLDGFSSFLPFTDWRNPIISNTNSYAKSNIQIKTKLYYFLETMLFVWEIENFDELQLV